MVKSSYKILEEIMLTVNMESKLLLFLDIVSIFSFPYNLFPHRSMIGDVGKMSLFYIHTLQYHLGQVGMEGKHIFY